MSTATRSTSRTPAGWTVVGLALAALLGLAFYAVVSVQVLKAQSRQMDVQVRQTAFADCLQYVVGSTIASCGSRLGTQQAESPAAPPDLLVVSGR
ncbi:hypothetical protein JI739_10455 [Ramlibacter sp. AW1]|uniref:Uncharacterized protein n=1 Tax=Ramlibacter aurantiacus TaxID=2801330 RepID=A0A936ZTB0_9BURK|nr:hypothetical protein [Ramlibacter aurantiacus]MBL0420765.1 hypothetical protein [Ramlibacter aurantiacus]